MMFLSRILLVAIPILGLPADQPAEDVDTESGAPSYSGPPSQHTKPWPAPGNGYMGPPSQYTRPWPAQPNAWNGPRGYNVPSWRSAPRAAPNSFNMPFSQPEPKQSGIEVMGGSEGMPLPPVQSGVPFSELQPSNYAPTSFQPARSPSRCGMPFRSLCGNSGYNPGYGNGNSGYNPGYGNGNSGYNPGFGNGNFGYNPGFGNGNFGFNPGYGNGNSGFNPGNGNAVLDSGNSGFNPGSDDGNSGFNPGTDEENSGDQTGNSGFNPGYGNGNSYTPLPGRGSCYNVCGNNYRCGGYSNGYGYGGCRPSRPTCRTRCSIQPSCPPSQPQQWNGGNSFSCGSVSSGSGGWGYNPGYGGYNPNINRPAQNGYMGVNTLPAMSSGCGMSAGGGCSDRAAGPQVVASAPKTPIVFDETPAGDEEQDN